MVILAQRWAEAYMRERPGTVVQVSGGGSGTGLAALLNGTTDIANASRAIEPAEQASLRERRGVEAHETPVALDAVAIYVHTGNPVRALSLAELAAIFRGRIRTWDEVGGPARPIVLYSRENNSGTYVYFKEHVLGGADFAVHAQTLPGTAAVINAVTHDPNGIGYGGIGYGGAVRALAIRTDAGPVAPTLETAVGGRYPLARLLFMYTAGPPSGLPAEFLAWARSPRGQELVRAAGFFPLPARASGAPSSVLRPPTPRSARASALSSEAARAEGT